MTWKRPNRCEASGCPQAARFGEHIHLSSTRRPDKVAIFDLDEWEQLGEAFADGSFAADKLVEEAL